MKTLIILGLSTLLLISCSMDSSTQPNLENSSQLSMNQSVASKTVPFKGTYETTTVFSDPIVNSGSGQATHLGKSTITAIHSWANPDFAGTLEFVSSSGAKLMADISGIGQLPDENGIINFDGDADITGGTCRFTNATGHLTIKGQIDLTTADFSGHVEYKGHIQYAPVQIAGSN